MRRNLVIGCFGVLTYYLVATLIPRALLWFMPRARGMAKWTCQAALTSGS